MYHFRNKNNNFLKKCYWIIALTLSISCLLSARLFYLQNIQHEKYTLLSKKQSLYHTTLPAVRGRILDRNGVLLAENKPNAQLYFTPQSKQDIGKILQDLSTILHLSKTQKTLIYKNSPSYTTHPTLLIESLSTEQQLAFYTHQKQLPGVFLHFFLKRHYPLHAIAGNLLGYVRATPVTTSNPTVPASLSLLVGQSGIERYYDTLLQGKPGNILQTINAKRKKLSTLQITPPIPGKDIYLTIDSNLQKSAELALGNCIGAVVVLSVKTGDILALASTPTFDPNLLLQNNQTEIAQHILNNPHHPLFNRAISGQYAPGSTIKPFVAIVGLENHRIHAHTAIFDTGTFQVNSTSRVYHDWKKRGHGLVNLHKALVVSCDTFFYILSFKLGINNIADMLQKFHFGKKTGVDFPLESTGLVPTPPWKYAKTGSKWYTGDTLLTGIGQGFVLATPLQLAAATATLAEHGKKIPAPHFLLSELTPTLASLPAVTLHNVTTWKTIHQAMVGVITEQQGTAHNFGTLTHLVAAKTGTAQVYAIQNVKSHTPIPQALRDNHLFIGFTPAPNPEIAIAVVVEHTPTAVSIAHTVLAQYFASNNLLTLPTSSTK